MRDTSDIFSLLRRRPNLRNMCADREPLLRVTGGRVTLTTLREGGGAYYLQHFYVWWGVTFQILTLAPNFQ